MPDINTLILFGIAFLNAIAAIAAWQTRKDAAAIKEDAAEIKIHSNSMKDEVVKAKEEVARLTGIFEGQARSEKEAANHAKGKVEGERAKSGDPLAGTAAPLEVEVINEEQPVPVKITEGQVQRVVDAVKREIKPKVKRKVRKKPRRR